MSFFLVAKLCIFLFILEQFNAFPIGGQFILSLDSRPVPHGKNKYVLPEFDYDASRRFDEIEINQAGYKYGPPLLGVCLSSFLVYKSLRSWFNSLSYPAIEI